MRKGETEDPKDPTPRLMIRPLTQGEKALAKDSHSGTKLILAHNRWDGDKWIHFPSRLEEADTEGGATGSSSPPPSSGKLSSHHRHKDPIPSVMRSKCKLTTKAETVMRKQASSHARARTAAVADQSQPQQQPQPEGEIYFCAVAAMVLISRCLGVIDLPGGSEPCDTSHVFLTKTQANQHWKTDQGNSCRSYGLISFSDLSQRLSHQVRKPEKMRERLEREKRVIRTLLERG